MTDRYDVKTAGPGRQSSIKTVAKGVKRATADRHFEKILAPWPSNMVARSEAAGMPEASVRNARTGWGIFDVWIERAVGPDEAAEPAGDLARAEFERIAFHLARLAAKNN